MALRHALIRLHRDETGSFAVLLALLLIPIVFATGAAVDLSRGIHTRAQLVQAADAAGLAVGGAVGLSVDEANRLGQTYFDANFPPQAELIERSMRLTVTDQVVTIDATARMRTTFLAAFGIKSLPVSVRAEITRESKGLEVMMVLDNTGSMNSSGKIGALRTATTDLITILFGAQTEADQLRIGMVPFVTAVNINAPGFSMDWIDRTAQARYHGVNFDAAAGGARVNHLDLFDEIRNTQWKGCVEARPEPYDTTDDGPDPLVPDTLWVPYFWPDEPDGESSRNYSNSYENDHRGGSREHRQRYWQKYINENSSIDETPSSTRGPNRSCADPVIPLTNNRDFLLGRTAAMRAWNNSGTNIAQGLVWGWRLLSPKQPFGTGVAYNDEETQKALILLTDGENQVVTNRGHNKSDYTSYGYLRERRLGTNRSSTFKSKINDKVSLLCQRIKAKGVRVYTITFRLNSNTLKNLFRACATEPELYFDSPSNEELRTTFRQIAQDLSNLRVSQ